MTEKAYCLRINIEPVGKGRPRAVSRGGFVSMYTPKKTAAFENEVAQVARKLFQGESTITTPVAVKVLAAFNRPKSKHRRKDPDGLILKTTKPDADNVLKAALDALVLAQVLQDDAIVVDARCVKAHAGKNEQPRLVIWITEVDEVPDCVRDHNSE